MGIRPPCPFHPQQSLIQCHPLHQDLDPPTFELKYDRNGVAITPPRKH